MTDKTELLAPAKDFASAADAIDCGADAVYMGAARFGARHAASNSDDDIARTVDYAHRFGVRVYATLNTLLYDNETDEARNLAERTLAAGVDALIVQDTAYCRMGLDAELHASTQMFNATPEQARFLGEAGFARVILERGLSLEQITEICSATEAEVECFVHGAICVGYSGRCFLSRSMSDRSGNRGVCTQACRLTYDLTDGNRRIIMRGKHLLSLRDLALDDRIGCMLDAGVRSFKIEGRLKDRLYVRNTVSFYRRALDRALELRPHLKRASSGTSRADFTPDLSKSFTRGATHYVFDGRKAGIASFDTPKAVGEYMGRVAAVGRHGIEIEGRQPATGDGLCFICGGGMVGTSVNGVEGRQVTPNRIEGIKAGAEVYRNFDRTFARSVENARIRRSIEAAATVTIAPNGIEAEVRDCDGFSARAGRTAAFDRADNPGRMEATAKAQFSKSGDSIFDIASVVVVNPQQRFVPVSLLNALRREALEALTRERIAAAAPRRPFVENHGARYPKASLGPLDNVTNRLAEEFYRSHGVTAIERGLDTLPSTVGHEVMRTPYCIRREIGQCLRQKHTLTGDLWLEHGCSRYLLQFDCARCEMALVDRSKRS